MPTTKRRKAAEGTQRMTDLAMFADEIRKGFETLASRFATQGADHDNIIRLLAGQETAQTEMRELRRDMESRHTQNVETVNRLEGRIRTQEATSSKLSGVHLAIVTIVPTLISVGIALLGYSLHK